MAEGAPRHRGQELARRLAQAGMHTTLIPDSAIFAMMARVNKVAPQPWPSGAAVPVQCLSAPLGPAQRLLPCQSCGCLTPVGLTSGLTRHVTELTQRCEQVLVGAHALLANGGVMAGAGNQLTAMAAKHHAVPFVVLVGLQKLSPLFPHDPSVSFNDFKACRSDLSYSIL